STPIACRVDPGGGRDVPGLVVPMRLPCSWLPLATWTLGQPSLTRESSPESSLALFRHWAPDSAVAPTCGQPSLITPSPSSSELFEHCGPDSAPPTAGQPSLITPSLSSSAPFPRENPRLALHNGPDSASPMSRPMILPSTVLPVAPLPAISTPCASLNAVSSRPPPE